MRVRTVDFVTIKPAIGADGQPKRVPMPGRYGLPHGSALPAGGWKVNQDEFVQRLLAEKAVTIVEPAAPAAKPAATTTTSAGSAA